MAFVPLLGVVKVQMIFSKNGQRMQNVYHVKPLVTIDADLLADIGDQFKAWYDSDLRPVQATDLTLLKMDIRDMSTESGIAIEYTAGLPLSGDGGQTGLPNNVTVAVKWVTGLAGRSYRGRTYHLGLRSGQISGSSLAEGAPAQIANVYFGLIDVIDTAGWELVVASTMHNNAPREVGLTTVITGCSVDPDLDSQRRRLPGRGE